MNLLLLLRAAAVLPSTLAAITLAYVPWDVPNNDVKHAVFPMNISKAPYRSGYYFVQYFILNGQTTGNYIGLQPQDDGTVHAVFSTFMDGSTTSDDNCHRGPGGRGVKCAVDLQGTYSNTYDLDLRNIEGTTSWTGTAIDTVTGISTHIGTFILPSGSGTTLAWHRGLVAYLPSTLPCSELPNTSVVFGVPRTDAGVGTLNNPYEAGACGSHDSLKFTRTADNEVDISIGFPSNLEATFRSQPEEDYVIGTRNGL